MLDTDSGYIEYAHRAVYRAAVQLPYGHRLSEIGSDELLTMTFNTVLGRRSPTHYLERLREEHNRARFLTSRLLWYSRACNALTSPIQLADGPMIRFRPGAMAANLWVDAGKYDRALEFLRRYAKAGDHIVDVGANIGVHTVVAAARVGSRGRVISIEPHPRTFTYLLENVELNGFDWVQCHNVAAGAGEGDTYITSLTNDDQNSLGSHGDTPVRLITLDRLLRTQPDIKLLKIDVDGYETSVLEGAKEVLRRTDCVLFEAADGYPQRYGYSLQTVFDELGKSGMSIYRVRDGESLVPIAAPVSGMREDLVAARDIESVAARTKLSWERDPE